MGPFFKTPEYELQSCSLVCRGSPYVCFFINENNVTTRPSGTDLQTCPESRALKPTALCNSVDVAFLTRFVTRSSATFEELGWSKFAVVIALNLTLQCRDFCCQSIFKISNSVMAC